MIRFALVVVSIIVGMITIAAFAVHFYGASLTTVSVKIGVAAGIVTSMGIIFTKVVRPTFLWIHDTISCMEDFFLSAYKLVNAHKNVDLPLLVKEVSAIRAELLPNGGSSVRDAINRIEEKVILTDRMHWAIRQDGPYGIFRCDKEGRNLEVNRTFCRWLSVGADELLSHGWQNFVRNTPENDEFHQEWVRAFSQGREIELSCHMKTSSGLPITLDIKAYPLTNRTGQIGEYLGVMKLVE